jgi:heat shock protein HtpX
MVVAAVLTPLVVLAAVAAVVVLLPMKFAIAVGIAAVIGVVRAIHARNEMERAHALPRESAPELHDAVERLCALADLSKPDIVVEDERQPNSWIMAPIGKRPRLHVTRGLLAALTPEELEAVVAHELAHLLNRDAMVMTVVGTPGAVLLEGGRRFWGAWWMWFGNGLALAIGGVAQFGTSALSRYRELAADDGAVALTGRPATLASALVKVSGGIQRLPISDLRAVAGRDSFHLLPTAESEFAPLRTHPALKRRLERLERMERDLHARGLAYRPADEPPA